MTHVLRPFAVLLLGLCTTLIATRWQADQNELFASQRFDSAVGRLGAEVERRMHMFVYGLRGARGAIVAAGEKELSRSVFQRYSETREVDLEFSGARGFGFIRRVSPAEVARFVDSARRDDWPDFSIAEFNPNAGERYVIQYIEPVARNKQAVGLDIASETNRRTAALESVRINGPAITEPITLVQAAGASQRSVLVLLPIYNPGLPLDSPERRTAATFGWAYAPLVLDEVFAGLAGTEPHIQWQIDGRSDVGQPQTIVNGGNDSEATIRQLTKSIPIFNRSWVIQAQATPVFEENLKLTSPTTVGITGSLVTVLLTLTLALWLRVRRREVDSLEAKARLATIVENTDQAVVGEDDSGCVMLWNRSASQLFRFDEREVIGKRLSNVLLRMGMELKPINEDASASVDTASEVSLIALNSASRVLSVSRSPILAPDGRRLGKATLFQDITDRKVMEHALALSNQSLEAKVAERTEAASMAEKFLRTVLDSVPSMISYWDLQGANRAANAAFLHWLGLPREDVEGKLLHELLPPEKFQGLDQCLAMAWAGTVCDTEFQACESQSNRWRDFAGTLIPDIHNGQARGLYFIAEDVTETKLSRQAQESAFQEKSEEQIRLASIIEGTNAGTWEWNVQTGETRFNERWADIVGYRLEELEPVSIQTWKSLAHPDDLKTSTDLLERHFRGELAYYEFEARMRHRDGYWIWVLDRGRVMTRTSDGQPEWMFGTHQDVTQRHAIEDALRRAKSVAESANLAKSQFLANISHEIRTPLNALLGMHRLLEHTELGPKQRDLLVKADGAGRALMDILNDVLDLAKIEAGEMSLHKRAFDLKAMFDEVTSVFASSATQKNVFLSTHVDPQVPQWIVGDRLRVRQVLSNLLGNAIKFTEEGGVMLQAGLEMEEGIPRLRLAVKDTGIGISPAALGRLFVPFAQADDSTTRRFGGTGLGLSIVRNLVQMMDGRVEAHSTPGRGSEFIAFLPLEAAQNDAVLATERLTRAIEVGMLCDDRAMCEQLQKRFDALGWKSTNLDETPSSSLDLLLVDAGLKSMGESKLAAIRLAMGPQAAAVPMILVGDSHELASFGQGVLGETLKVQKPVEVSALFNAVIEVLSETDSLQARLIGQTKAIEGGLHWLHGAQVLVVDDSEINREIATELLRAQGSECHTCCNGREALVWLEKNIHAVDAVLMDVQMPVMDGLEASRLIKDNPKLRHLPIVALTAGALDSERTKAQAAGMNAFLTKPLEAIELVRTLRNLITESRGGFMRVALPSTPKNDDLHRLDGDWPLIDGIDLELAKPRASDSPVLFARLLKIMKKNYSGWGAEWLARARNKGHAINEDLCGSLHKLRGGASMLGAVGVAEEASFAEVALGVPGQDPLSALQKVVAELDDLLDSIDEWELRRAKTSDPVVDRLASHTLANMDGLLKLLALLRDRDLDAVDLVSKLDSDLRAVLAPEGTEKFMALVEHLDFDAAQLRLVAGLAAFGVDAASFEPAQTN